VRRQLPRAAVGGGGMMWSCHPNDGRRTGRYQEIAPRNVRVKSQRRIHGGCHVGWVKCRPRERTAVQLPSIWSRLHGPNRPAYSRASAIGR
jgi:hypothetical protein